MTSALSSPFIRLGRLVATLAVVGGIAAAPVGHAAPNSAAVVAVEPARAADLVILNGGFDTGLRQGIVCRISRGGTEVAEVLLVELRPALSAALILSVAPGQSIRAGDVAHVKLIKS